MCRPDGTTYHTNTNHYSEIRFYVVADDATKLTAISLGYDESYVLWYSDNSVFLLHEGLQSALTDTLLFSKKAIPCDDASTDNWYVNADDDEHYWWSATSDQTAHANNNFASFCETGAKSITSISDKSIQRTYVHPNTQGCSFLRMAKLNGNNYNLRVGPSHILYAKRDGKLAIINSNTLISSPNTQPATTATSEYLIYDFEIPVSHLGGKYLNGSYAHLNPICKALKIFIKNIDALTGKNRRQKLNNKQKRKWSLRNYGILKIARIMISI